MKAKLPLATLLVGLVSLTGYSQTVLSNAEDSIHTMNRSLRNEAQSAIDRAEKWLLSIQQPDGNWSSPEFPALTGLPLWAMAMDGKMDRVAQKKAVDFILSHARPNGAIFATPSEERKGGGLPNYNTAICMLGLHMVNDTKLNPVILKARKFMTSMQHAGNDEYKGGFGYDASTKRAYTDLSNTFIAAEAMALTAQLEDLRSEKGEIAKIDNKALAEYVFNLQQKDGGIRYHPNNSKASTDEENEARQFRSYGSMTYAGLLTLIYADVDKRDPRARSAYDWTLKHWSLEENPGMGQQGVYYFYNVLSKCMAAMGQDVITLENGQKVNWRTEVVKKLINLQQIAPDGKGHGYWTNPTSRWFEADPVLVTSYTLIALKTALN